jgi:hypothetical protein
MPSRAGGLGAWAALVVAWFVAPFVGAGTLRWPHGWLFVAVLAVGLLTHRAYVGRRNPDLLKKRKNIGEGTKTWDKVWLAVFWPLMLLVPLVAGVHVMRAGGTPLRNWVWPIGVVLFGAGMAV